jgi:glutamate formiminotransferase/glutamate formiminotransferase/formiminotetrahydrofolate cyclodeaminase
MSAPLLLGVPNVSEGRSVETIAAIGAAFAGDGAEARLLDVHSDPDHHRSVFTLAARQGALADALVHGAACAVERIDVMSRGGSQERGQHPHVGAVDVAPVVYLRAADRGAACAEALVLAERIGGELDVPVFLYGELTAEGRDPWRGRAELRRGGVQGLAARMAGAGGEPALRPDFGPGRLHPRAGATLVAAREPLVAFNLQLAPGATLAHAQAIAASIREGGKQGMPGLRAIGVALGGGVAQVSMNVERPLEVPLASIVEAVRGHARIASAELVGLAPARALEGFPDDLPMPGFDPARHLIENALG